VNYHDFDDREEFEGQPEKENLQDKIKQYEEFLKESEGAYIHTEIVEELIDLYMLSGQYEKALFHVQKLIELFPYTVEYWLRRGIILNNMSEYEKALLSFHKALMLNPNES
jgi:tetratricopeptide (TPR) repeat protein